MKVYFKFLFVSMAIIMLIFTIPLSGQTPVTPGIQEMNRSDQSHHSQKGNILSQMGMMRKNTHTYARPEMQIQSDYQANKLNEGNYEYLEYAYAGMNIPFAGIADEAGNLYITGSSSNVNAPTGNFVTIKINPEGVLVWEARQEAIPYCAEFGMTVALDSGGNPIVSGVKWNGNDMDMRTIKYNKETGNVIWDKLYDAGKGGLEVPADITVDKDGNVIITGIGYAESYVGYLTIKYDNNGNEIWAQMDDPEIEGIWIEPYAVLTDKDGNIAVTGYSSDEDFYQVYYTVKYAPNGNLLWKKKYLFSRNIDETDPGSGITKTNSVARDLAFDEYGNCYVSGTFDRTTLCRIGTIKYDADGNEVWVQTYKSAEDVTFGTNIATTVDGTIYVAGKHFGNWIDDGITLISYAPDGTQNWVRETNDLVETADVCMMLDSENRPVVCGYGYAPESSDRLFRIQKYNTAGEIVDDMSYLKPYSPMVSVNNLVNIGVDTENNVYLMSDVTYTLYGNVFEHIKLSSATENDLVWEKTYANNGASNAGVLDAIPDADGNTYVTGSYGMIYEELYTSSYYVAKYNASGEVVWTKEFNATNGNVGSGIRAYVNNNGDIIVYLLVGTYDTSPSRIIKYTSDGILLWEMEKEFEMPDLYTLLIDKQDNIYLAGTSKDTSSDRFNAVISVTKIAGNNGSEVWTKYFTTDETTNSYTVNSGQLDSEGNIVLTGNYGTVTMFSQMVDFLTLKIDHNGNLAWMTPLATEGFNTSGTDLHIDKNDNIYINGVIQNHTTFEEQLSVTKLNTDGSFAWARSYGEEGRRVRSYTIKPLYSEQYFVVSGFSVLDNTNVKNVLLKYDPEGNQLWNINSDLHHFYGDMHVDDKDNIYILNQVQISSFPRRINYSLSDIPLAAILKVSPEGTIISEEKFYGPELSYYICTNLVPHRDGRMLIAGELSHELSFFSGAFIFESRQEVTGIDEIDAGRTNGSILGQNYPNPVKSYTQIPFRMDNNGKATISLYDLNGKHMRTLFSRVLNTGNYTIAVDLSGLDTGIYLYQLDTDNGREIKRLIVK